MRRLTTLVALFVIGGAVACSLSCCSTKRDFEIQELLIDETVFPSGWLVSTSGPRRPARAPLGHYEFIESIELFFYVYGGGAREKIYRFADARGAA